MQRTKKERKKNERKKLRKKTDTFNRTRNIRIDIPLMGFKVNLLIKQP